MLADYRQDPEPTMFLSGQFQSPRRNFHNSEEVEIDIVRSEEDVSIAIQDLSTGARFNSEDTYTNKAFKPPVHKEAGPINAHTLIKRLPGRNPFESVDFQAAAVEKGLALSRKLQRKILRAIELQASQVLTTGTVTLTDENGNAVYTIDYKPKATHFPTVSNDWGTAGEDPLGDIESLGNVIRADGMHDADIIEMGEGSFENFVKNSDVQTRFDTRRADMGGVVPMQRLGNGGIFRGTVEVGNYKYDVFTYPGRYKDPQTGNSTKFLQDDKVVIRASSGRLDATFGGIPRIGRPDPRVPAGLTGRVSVPGQQVDIQLNAWVTPDGETLMVSAGTRPLLIPTAIDTFGCIDTVA
jgi:hypothetical protein